MIKVGIIGATGYTGIELVRILLNHPHVQITVLCSESHAGDDLGDVYPHLRNKEILKLSSIDLKKLLTMEVDLFFIALPSGEAMKMASVLLKKGKKIIDLSADFRLLHAKDYLQWYNLKHTSPSLISEAVYGLPEINKINFKEVNLAANPGCYPTASLLAFAPLVFNDLIDLDSIIIDAKSGISGAGKQPTATVHFSETNSNISAYQIAVHRHIPEIEQGLSLIKTSKKEHSITFIPHLIPVNRGILATVYASTKEKSQEKLQRSFKDFYKDAFFVRVLSKGKSAQIKNVYGSNFCDLSVHFDERTGKVIVLSAIDNLVKGAAGNAVQIFNLMFGLDETLALVNIGPYPV
jgi:N-acetyl-gamma-glutamyl-phosphate reductase